MRSDAGDDGDITIDGRLSVERWITSALSEITVDWCCRDGASGSGLIVKRQVMNEVRRRTSSRIVVNAEGMSKISRTEEKGVPEPYNGFSNDSGH